MYTKEPVGQNSENLIHSLKAIIEFKVNQPVSQSVSQPVTDQPINHSIN